MNSEVSIYWAPDALNTGFSHANIRSRSVVRTGLPYTSFPCLLTIYHTSCSSRSLSEAIIQQHRHFPQKRHLYCRQMPVFNCQSAVIRCRIGRELWHFTSWGFITQKLFCRQNTCKPLSPHKSENPQTHLQIGVSLHSGRTHWHIKIKEADNLHGSREGLAAAIILGVDHSRVSAISLNKVSRNLHTHTFHFSSLVSVQNWIVLEKLQEEAVNERGKQGSSCRSRTSISFCWTLTISYYHTLLRQLNFQVIMLTYPHLLPREQEIFPVNVEYFQEMECG